MKPIFFAAIALVTAVMLTSCGQQAEPAPQPAAAAASQTQTIEGTVTLVTTGHGNVFTNILPNQYESLALTPGKRIRVTFGDTQLTLVIGRNYNDVPSGTPLAVLHREALGFAICNGNFSTQYGIAVGAKFRIDPVAPAE